MQYLHTHFYIFTGAMNRLSNHSVLVGFFRGRQFGACPAFYIRRNTTCNNHTDTTSGTFRKIGRHAFKSIFGFFKPSMHRPHNGAVFYGSKT